MKFNDITNAANKTPTATPLHCLPAQPHQGIPQPSFPAHKNETHGDQPK
jgi:hypothetical protein